MSVVKNKYTVLLWSSPWFSKLVSSYSLKTISCVVLCERLIHIVHHTMHYIVFKANAILHFHSIYSKHWVGLGVSGVFVKQTGISKTEQGGYIRVFPVPFTISCVLKPGRQEHLLISFYSRWYLLHAWLRLRAPRRQLPWRPLVAVCPMWVSLGRFQQPTGGPRPLEPVRGPRPSLCAALPPWTHSSRLMGLLIRDDFTVCKHGSILGREGV